MPNKMVSLFKSKGFKALLLLALFLAAFLIGMSMLLGQEAGSFVIKVQNNDVKKSVMITENEDPYLESAHTPLLDVKGMEGMNDYSPEYFLEEDFGTLKNLVEPMGFTDYDNKSLYIYTFYIVNKSTSGGVGVKVSLEFNKVTNYLDEIIRVLTFYQTYNVAEPQIYQKADDVAKLKEKFPTLGDTITYSRYFLQPNNFKGNNVAFDDQIINIGYVKGQDYVKYSIMFWLEGDDPDSDYYQEKLYDGTINFSLKIEVQM